MRLVTLLALALLGGSCGGQTKTIAEPVSTPVPANVARAIEGAVEQYRQAYEVHSVDALAGLYVHDLDVVSVYQGRVHQGWSQVEADQKLRLQDVTKVRIVITDLNIQALGTEVAVATAGMERHMGDDATTTTERGSVTLVFHKVEGRWLVAAEHFSYPTSSP